MKKKQNKLGTIILCVLIIIFVILGIFVIKESFLKMDIAKNISKKILDLYLK
ncbi:MAG: hypothetical protein HFJ25_01070 [Clostridia bacterium]|nr:hypothetical protein [Clostridia bacterium]